MDLEAIKKLIALMDETALTEVEVEDSESRVRLRKERYAVSDIVSPQDLQPKAQEAPVSAEKPGERSEDKKKRQITSPIVGTFYKAPSPDANPYIELGDLVKKGQILCVVEAMKLMNEIESDLDGRVVEVCVEDGAAVEYGEALFTIEPA
ncbi:MAG: acetyl-CoA carboxylase biotin carboxyl carrier protein [Nitrospiria bacterium]